MFRRVVIAAFASTFATGVTAQDAPGPIDVAFQGFPQIRSYKVACSETDIYEVAMSFGALEGIQLQGDGVTLNQLARTSAPVSDVMKADVAAQLKQFASINSVLLRCGWRQDGAEKERGSYLRIEISGLRNCLSKNEIENLEELGSAESLSLNRVIEISPTSVAVEGNPADACAALSGPSPSSEENQ